MKKLFQAAVVAAAVLAVPALSLAAQTTPAATTTKTKAKSDSKAAAGTVYSAKGVVKSLDGSTLVLTEKSSKKKSHDVHFVVDASTQKDANIAAGSTVQVKYHNDAKKHVATEIRAGSAKKS